MGDSFGSLRERSAAEREVHGVEMFELPRDRRALDARMPAIHFVHDELDDQLGEFLALADPTRKLSTDEISARVATHLGDRPREEYGVWVFYPWSGRLVHCLPRDEHRMVRSDRNRYKLTTAELSILREKTIGVLGLSVGNMAAITLALEGVGGAYRLADFDRLSLSNLNRLRGGVH